MVRNKTGLLLIGLLVLSHACTDSSIVFQKSIVLPESGWDRDHNLEDSWVSDKTISHGSIILQIRHTSKFGYQNLYVAGKVRKNDQTVWSDTFSIGLACSNSGEWLGEKQGEEIVVRDTIPYTISLEKGETLHYDFSQFSRDDVLQGIEEVVVGLIDKGQLTRDKEQ